MTGPSAESAGVTIAVPTVLAAAVDQARAAVAEFSGVGTVGEHLGVDYEDFSAATHRFEAQLPGYRGWQWAVVIAASPGAAQPTVSEVALVPGPTALLAPEWVPWDQRVRPGDLGPGDLLAPPADDPRLVPGYVSSGDPQLDAVAGEIGLGRRWLMSPVGRADAAQRWHDGEYGPDSAMARSTKKACRDCGFYLPLAGGLGTVFGVCGNELSADGHVVDISYGCGAHSDTPAPAGAGSPAYEPYDDGMLEVFDVVPVAAVAAESAAAAADSVPAADDAVAHVPAEVLEDTPIETVVDDPAAEAAVAPVEVAAEGVVEETAVEAAAEPIAEAVEETAEPIAAAVEEAAAEPVAAAHEVVIDPVQATAVEAPEAPESIDIAETPGEPETS